MSLAVQMNTVKPSEHISELKMHVEQFKKKIEELDSTNCYLSMQWSKLAMELRDMETSFHAKVNKCSMLLKLTLMMTDDCQGYRDGTLDQATCRIQYKV